MQLPDELTSAEGTLEFVMELDRPYRSGRGTETTVERLLTFQGLGRVEFRPAPGGARLWWRWETERPFRHILQAFPEWPGPERYCIQYTWKADEGLMQLFINGTPTRLPDARFAEPWDFGDRASEVILHDGPIRISDLETLPRHTPAEELRERVPDALRGRHADLFWDFPEPENPIDADALDREPIARNPLSSPGDVEDWVMEGPGEIGFEDGWMMMRSTKPDAGPGENGHIVFWRPEKLPDSFVAEWEVQLLNDPGLLIAFFAAMGKDGEDLFDPALPDRDGTFRHYVKGAIRCYHISYYSNPEHEPGRTTTNMRKNPPAMMVDQGPVGIPPGSDRIHEVQLVKLGDEVQLSVDGRIAIRWTDDDPERFGDPYGAGYFGLRQMQWTEARYRDLRIDAVR